MNMREITYIPTTYWLNILFLSFSVSCRVVNASEREFKVSLTAPPDL